MADEVQRLILQVEGQAQLERLNAELEKEEKNLRAALANRAAGATVSAQVIEGQAAAVLSLRKQIDDLNKETRRINPANVMALTYALDDLVNTGGGIERKIASISNNLPQLLGILGLTGGGLGIFALIATGFAGIASHWQEISDAIKSNVLGIGADQLEGMREKVEALRKEFEKLSKAPTKAEASGARSITEVVTEHGADELAAAAARTLSMTGLGEDLTDEERELLKSPLAEIPKYRQEMLNKIYGRINKANAERAQRLIAGITRPGEEGKQARLTLRELVGKNPGAFPKGFLGDLERSEPEEIAAQQALEAEGKLNAANQQRRWDARRKAEEKAEALRKRREERHARQATEQTDAILRGHAQEIRDEERAEKQEAANVERDDAANLREWEAAKKTRPYRRARAAVLRMSRENGLGDPTADQADDMAREALKNMEDGMTAQAAAWMAVLHQVRQIQAASARFAREMQAQAAYNSQLMGGQDFSGGFGLMPGAY